MTHSISGSAYFYSGNSAIITPVVSSNPATDCGSLADEDASGEGACRPKEIDGMGK
ncbi:MAG: hypothetical protein AAB433_20050 [Nitrospirota bacterium]